MPAQVVIENPILNSPFEEPKQHFRFTDDGITNEVVEARRVSSYFVPIAKPRKKGGQMAFDTEWTQDRVEENDFINRVRGRVALWRRGGYLGVSRVTRRLLEYWKRDDRARRLFFCQIEALETIIYLTEVARKSDPSLENELRRENENSNPLLYRIGFKVATGSGKTVVMAMMIAWHTLNKLENPQDARFTDAFLIVTPGITIRDRLRVLLPNDPDTYFRKMDIVPSELLEELGKAKIIITNFHAFLLHERIAAGKLTKSILSSRVRGEETGPFTETPDQMVRRVCRELGGKKNIVVINDEAHHCYRHRPDPQQAASDGTVLASAVLKGDERKEAENRRATRLSRPVAAHPRTSATSRTSWPTRSRGNRRWRRCWRTWTRSPAT
jgi:type III restriction enzyme